MSEERSGERVHQRDDQAVAQEQTRVKMNAENTPLVAISYAFQRHELEAQAQQIPLLISASSSTLPLAQRPESQKSKAASEPRGDWYIASTGVISSRALQTLCDAYRLAQVDGSAARRLITPQGRELSQAFEEEADELKASAELQSQTGWDMSLSDQITSLIAVSSYGLSITEPNDAPDSPSAQEPQQASSKGTVTSQSLKRREAKSESLSDTTTIDAPQAYPPPSNSKRRNDRTTLPPSSEREGHLLLIVSNSLESISPRIRSADLDAFQSVTMLMDCAPDRVLSWHRWSTSLGGAMIRLNDHAFMKLADRMQRASRGLQRVQLTLNLSSGFVLMGVTQLTSQLGPLPIDSRDQGGASNLEMWAELPLGDERWSALFMIKYTGQRLGSTQQTQQQIGKLSADGFSAPLFIKLRTPHLAEVRQARVAAQSSYIKAPLGGISPPQYDQLMLGVAFAQQLSHRVRVIDNLLLSLLRRDSRKPGKLLDQLIKITAALESSAHARVFQELKVEFLALGELPMRRWEILISALLRSTHRLSSEGQWSSISPPLDKGAHLEISPSYR